MAHLSWTQLLLNSFGMAALIWSSYHLFSAAYNVFLHTLRLFPGPKLAAASYLPDFYYDVICVSRYTTKIRKMHEVYGKLLPGKVGSELMSRRVSKNMSLTQDRLYVSTRTSCTAMTPSSLTRYTPWVAGRGTSHSTRSTLLCKQRPHLP